MPGRAPIPWPVADPASSSRAPTPRLAGFFPDADVEVCASGAETAAAIATRPFAGAVVDAGLPEGHATRLAAEFLERQPAGRIALACHDADVTTLRAVVARDPRAELVFAPWDGEVLRRCLLAPVAMGAFTRPARPAAPLARLLGRR